VTATASPVELCRRLTRVNIAYTVARMKVIEARSGQPVEVRRFGDAAALMARQVPSPHFNAVVGLRGGQENLVGELDDWYRANHLKGRFVIAPFIFTELSSFQKQRSQHIAGKWQPTSRRTFSSMDLLLAIYQSAKPWWLSQS